MCVSFIALLHLRSEPSPCKTDVCQHHRYQDHALQDPTFHHVSHKHDGRCVSVCVCGGVGGGGVHVCVMSITMRFSDLK